MPAPAPLPSFIRAIGPDAILAVAARPRARANSVDGIQGNALKVRIAAPPVDGAANEAIERCLAEALRVARSRVQVLHGAASRHKALRIVGLTPSEVLDRLNLPPAAFPS
jgi:uncharacterized protein (TIGR00251 family)